MSGAIVRSDSFRLDEIIKEFSGIYDGTKPEFISRASGRVELIGGHTDYNEGFVIAAAIDKSCWTAASKRKDRKIRIYSQWAKQLHEFDLDAGLRPSNDTKWANYGRGVTALLLQKGLALCGANLYIAGNIPVGAGLSSSAALEVSLARAMLRLAALINQVSLLELAKICQKAENVYANSPCGIMDQIVSLAGKNDHAIFLDCRNLSIEPLPLDAGRCSIMVFNSMVRHEVGGGEYGKRRQQCQQACAAVARKYPQVKALRDADADMLASVQKQLDSVSLARAKHVIGENARVLAARNCLRSLDVVGFGKLMCQSHASARDLYEISCDEINLLVDEVCRCDGAYGARLSGGGFGGAAVVLLRSGSEEDIASRVAKAYKNHFAIDVEIHLVRPSEGVEVIEV